MHIIEKIKDVKSMKQLDDLRDEIRLAASFNEIDFKQVQGIFLEKKEQMQLLREKHMR